jgi:hypothetical protein
VGGLVRRVHGPGGHDPIMITKDFHLAKDFRQIRGKSFVITVA